MKKIVCSLVMVFVLFFSFAVVGFAAKETETLNVIDFENRYTDISELDDLNNPYLDAAKDYEGTDAKRTVYIVVLVVLLIVAIGVFVYTLRKVPAEETFQRNEKEKLEESTESAKNIEE